MEAEGNNTVGSSCLDQKECQNSTAGSTPFSNMKQKEEKIQKNAQEEPGEKSCPREDGPPCEDDVLCDSCIESPRKAKKSCLTCLVSYCEDHLRPHLEKEKFQSHRLVKPLKDVEIRMCETHNVPLELFCCVETSCVCEKCVSEQHHGHETLSITEARQKMEKELQEKQTELVKTVTAAENSINKLQSCILSVEACVCEVRSVLQQQVSALQAGVEEVRAELTKVLEAEMKNTLGQVGGARVCVVQRCDELKRAHTHLDKLSKNKNSVDFLQEYSQWRKTSSDVSLPEVCVTQTDRLQSFGRIITHTTQELCDILLTAYRNSLKEFCTTDDNLHQPTVHPLSPVQQNITLPEPQSRDDFLKYASPLTFDGDTVHQFLRVTEGGRKLTNTTPWQHSYPEHPERFQHWKQALSTQSFSSGRHYFEMDLSGAGVHVGVTYVGILRQSNQNEACLTGSSVSWCVEWSGRGFSAWHGGVETPLSTPKATRLGVCVDFRCGTVMFYSVRGEAEGGMELLHRFETELREPLYAAVFLPKKENVVVLVEPGEELPLKSPLPPCSPP
ncbi:tripartite motif-containing protein 16-like [Ictalurus furcatus]|uniref:tripartite motif-containing protein 16-like n=1 Tax=Ictalurus furcatus TaxID=66913 RepID=UPI002350B5CF|nr:tripartite motif-containing protein 16-like [Ictalurus furcatus]